MTDERSTSSSLQPTKANMVESMKWLVNGARRGDQLFFHFSGHGTQVRDRSGDESDGFDESLMPVDYKKAGPLIDDVLHEIFVKNLPNGVRLTALLDCCHSGSLMDLPFAYKAPLNKSRAMEVPQFASLKKKYGGGYEKEDKHRSRGIKEKKKKKKHSSSSSSSGSDDDGDDSDDERKHKSRGFKKDKKKKKKYDSSSSGSDSDADEEEEEESEEEGRDRDRGRFKKKKDKKHYGHHQQYQQQYSHHQQYQQQYSHHQQYPPQQYPPQQYQQQYGHQAYPQYPQQPHYQQQAYPPQHQSSHHQPSPSKYEDTTSPGEVVMLSGCQDNQTSADVSDTSGFHDVIVDSGRGKGKAGGAMTNALVAVLAEQKRKGREVTYVQLLDKMLVYLRDKRMTQVPQLSSTNNFDLSAKAELDFVCE
eukprot:Selendium_serpulae@DN5536_c2_g1_i3.p1